MVNHKNELLVGWKRTAKHSENSNGKKVNFKTYEKIVNNENSTTQMYSIFINRLKKAKLLMKHCRGKKSTTCYQTHSLQTGMNSVTQKK